MALAAFHAIARRPSLALVAVGIALSSPSLQLPPAVYLIGDSTMAERADSTTNPERGWGMALAPLLVDGVAVHNAARNGRSTKSFIAEGRWQAVLDAVHAGDVVIIQFGHNDAKQEDSTRYASADGAYRANLERFVRESRDKGAVPVLATSIVRRKFDQGGRLEDTHGRYPVVTREVARALAVPLLDLQAASAELVARAGPEHSKALYSWTRPQEFAMYPDGHQDDTHLSWSGAARIAELATKQLKRAGGRLGALVR
jgi:lysophospholipase L1-like esterase